MEERSYSKTFYFLLFCMAMQTALVMAQTKVKNEVDGTKDTRDLRLALQTLLNQSDGAFVDPCTSAPCLNAGKCTVTSYAALTYRCQCVPGYDGLRCERGQNECLSSPCIHGVCIDHIGSFSCRCNPGFTGSLCATDIDECLSSPCFNGGSCVQGTLGRFTCVCPRGYRGTRCQTDIDECLSLSPCQNGGTCRQEGPGDYSCTCVPGFSGSDCEQQLDLCASRPCQNNGQCFHNQTFDTWQCHCGPGYTGAQCEQVLNPCDVEPQCEQGVCQPLPGGLFHCECHQGVTGRRCQTEINQTCSSDPCHNGGRCVSTAVGRYRCRCGPKFKGSNCQTQRQVCDGTRVTCQNGGSCILSRSRRQPLCVCAKGFSGSRCESKPDPCESRPCLNNATCQKVFGGEEFLCTCQTGFSGSACHRTEVTAATKVSSSTTLMFITTNGTSNNTQDDNLVRIYNRPIDPTTLFILLGILGVLALLIGSVILFLKLIGCHRPRDFFMELPWPLFTGLEPPVKEESEQEYMYNHEICNYDPNIFPKQDGNPSSPQMLDYYETPKPRADYTFRRY